MFFMIFEGVKITKFAKSMYINSIRLVMLVWRCLLLPVKQLS